MALLIAGDMNDLRLLMVEVKCTKFPFLVDRKVLKEQLTTTFSRLES